MKKKILTITFATVIFILLLAFSMSMVSAFPENKVSGKTINHKEYFQEKSVCVTDENFVESVMSEIEKLYSEYDNVIYPYEEKTFGVSQDAEGNTGMLYDTASSVVKKYNSDFVFGEKVTDKAGISVNTNLSNTLSEKKNTLYTAFLYYVTDVLPEQSWFWRDKDYHLYPYNRMPFYQLVVSTEYSKYGYSSAEEYYNATLSAFKNGDISALPNDIYFVSFSNADVRQVSEAKINIFDEYFSREYSDR